MARETINGISVPIPGTGEPADFVGDLRRIATDLSASTEATAGAVNVLNHGAVADSAGTAGNGTDNRAAFQAACDEAASKGLTRVVVPASPLGLSYRIVPGTTASEGAPNGYGVKVPAGIEIVFLPGAQVFCQNQGTAGRPIFLLERAHGAAIRGLRARGTMTSFATRDGLRAIVNYRSKNTAVTNLDVDGMLESYQMVANQSASTDTCEDNLIQDVTLGASMGAGIHLFGVHRRTTLRRYRVRGTLYYDALQIEPVISGPYLEGSEDFLGEDITIESCAYRGVFINPYSRNFTLRRVKVRNPGRLADGTIVGYDPGLLTRVVNNACITISASSGTLEDIDVSGGLTVTPVNQPAVEWSADGHGVRIIDPYDIVFRGRLSLGTNDAGDVYVDSPAGYNTSIKRVRFEGPGSAPRVSYGINRGQMPPVTSKAPTPSANASSLVKPINLLPSWNMVGPDGAIVSWVQQGGGLAATVSAAETLVAPGGRVVVTGVPGGSFPQLFATLDSRINLAKGRTAHLLVLGKFNSAAPSFSWTLGGLTSRRKGFPETVSGRDFQAGALRWMHSSIPFDEGDTFSSTALSLWVNYNASTSLDLALEAWWLYVTPTAPMGEPEFDFSAPQMSVAAPTAGTWPKGAVVLNANPTAGGTVGWVCTAAGTPGTWKTFGAISA